MRDVLVGALASELKVDVVETAHRGHARELGAQAAAEGMDLVVSVGGDGTVNEVVNGLLADGPGPARCRCSPSSRAARPTSSPGPGPLPRPGRGDRGDPRPRCAPAGPGWSPLGTASATGTSTAPLRGRRPGHRRRRGRRGRRRPGRVDAAALVRLRRRAGLRRRGDRPRRGAPGGRPALDGRALRQGGHQRLPARPRAAPSGDDAAAAGRARPRRAVPLPGLQRQPLDLPGRPAGEPVSPRPPSTPASTSSRWAARARCGCCTPCARPWPASPTPAAAACTAGTTWRSCR